MENTNENGPRSEKSVSKQITLAFLSNFSNLAPAMSIGFSAVVIPFLTHLTTQQISWFASIASLATPIGCVLSGPLADRWGRKCPIVVLNVIGFIGWSIVASAYYFEGDHQYSVLLTGRFLTGLSTGLCGAPASVYMAEISTSDLRSVFTTWVSLFYAAGIFLVYLLGALFKDNWGAISLIAAGCPILGMFFLILYIPESPLWLVDKSRIDEAKKSMCRLHGTKVSTVDVRDELALLIRNKTVKKNPGTTKTMLEQIYRKLKKLMKKSFLKPYLLVLTYFFIQQFSGIFVIMFYAIDIVQRAQVKLDSYITIVIIALTRLIAMILLSYFSKNYGRRPLSIISGSGMTVCMLTLGSYILAIKQGFITLEQQQSLGLVPVVLLILYFFISTMGFYPIPFALASEVYPGNIRGTASGISIGSNFVFNFIIVKLYPTMVENMGSYGVFFFYGGIALIGTFFVVFFLPETRGKSLEEIQAYFVTKKDNNIPEDEEKA